ncbi:MAG TPA: DUF3307 domain-containing protein [Ignavibacteriaceae bacterium]|nr:DUF3307 domain-containing protein [Ignavibacteriaceae bacterium]
MNTEIIWLTKLFLSHLFTDFILQRKLWIDDRKVKHFYSGYLYLHTFITALLAWILIGWQYWIVAIIILITHTLIDGWKSFQDDKPKYFFIDQILHLLVIVGCWYFTFYESSDIETSWDNINSNADFWIVSTAFVFLSLPAGFMIGELTKKWSTGLNNSAALVNGGRWIGIIERLVILILVLQNQYEAIGLLIAAKSILRFSENDRPEQKTEYLLIGTLISLCLAMVTGLLVTKLIA